MMKKKRGAFRPSKPASTYTVEEELELLPFLIRKLTGVGRNSIKSMLARGQITVDGQAVTAYNYALQIGQLVSISKEKVKAAAPFIGLRIIHEDEALIVVEKEAGLLTMASAQEQELTAYRQLTSYVRQTQPEARIFIVHRLDRDTSGVMMFAKTAKVQQLLQASWHETVKERTYIALVEGKVRQTEGTISSWLKETRTLKMYSSPISGDGQHAVTHFKTLQVSALYSLLQVHLETGRKNQIRVHMQDLGHPITGDKKYGARHNPINRLGLHAQVLSFIHPFTGKLLRFETKIPKAMLRPFAGNL